MFIKKSYYYLLLITLITFALQSPTYSNVNATPTIDLYRIDDSGNLVKTNANICEGKIIKFLAFGSELTTSNIVIYFTDPTKVQAISLSQIATGAIEFSINFKTAISTQNAFVKKCTDAATCNAATNPYSNSITFSVNAPPSVAYTSPKTSFTTTDGAYKLTGGTPTGGIYNGSGVSSIVNNGVTEYYFHSSNVPTGIQHDITYTYKNPTTGCSASAVQKFTVVDGNANYTVEGVYNEYCQGDTQSYPVTVEFKGTFASYTSPTYYSYCSDYSVNSTCECTYTYSNYKVIKAVQILNDAGNIVSTLTATSATNSKWSGNLNVSSLTTGKYSLRVSYDYTYNTDYSSNATFSGTSTGVDCNSKDYTSTYQSTIQVKTFDIKTTPSVAVKVKDDNGTSVAWINNYCYDRSFIDLVPVINNVEREYSTSLGRFTLSEKGTTISEVLQSNRIDLTKLSTSKTYLVTFTYAGDDTYCSYTNTPSEFSIAPKPTVEIFAVDNQGQNVTFPKTYCGNGDSLVVKIFRNNVELSTDDFTETDFKINNTDTLKAFIIKNSTLYFVPSTIPSGYNYSLTYNFTENNGCSGSHTWNTFISTPPKPFFTGLKSEYCHDAPLVALSADPQITKPALHYFEVRTIDNVLVDNSDNSIIDGNIFYPSNLEPGDYKISYLYTDANGCFNQSSWQNVTIHKIPNPNFTFENVCLGDTTIFTPDEISDEFNYRWNLGEGTLSEGAIAKKVYTTTGPKEVTLTITNKIGCMDKSTSTVTINPIPKARFTASGFCANNLTSFVASFTEVSATDVKYFIWKFEEGVIDTGLATKKWTIN